MSERETAIYTVQVWINGYAAPKGGDVEHFTSLQAIRDYLRNTITEAKGHGAAYGDEGNEALIYRGLLDDVTDQYPDLRAYVGPRGGIRFE